MMKHIFPIALVIAAAILGTVYFVKGPESETFERQEASEVSENATSSITEDVVSASEKTSTNSHDAEQAVTPAPSKPPVTPTLTPTKPPVSSGYTMAQVAIHADASSCWTAIGGKVYDLTSWISKHPGGKSAILRLCGVDGTAAFNDQHGGQARPERELASFFIGNLSS